MISGLCGGKGLEIFGKNSAKFVNFLGESVEFREITVKCMEILCFCGEKCRISCQHKF